MTSIRIAGCGMPKRKPLPKSTSDAPGDPMVIGRPALMISEIPRAIAIIASEMTKDGKRM